MKIRVSDSDGVYKGGLFKTHCFNASNCRFWKAPPRPDYSESLIDIAGKNNDCHVGSWFRLLIAKVQDISGPSDGSDDFDPNSQAIKITLAEAATWLEKYGFAPPPDLMALLHESGRATGATPPLPPPPTEEPLPDGAKEVWDALSGKVRSAKQLAGQLDSTEDAIRKRIALLNRLGRVVANRRGAGYFRPDAP